MTNNYARLCNLRKRLARPLLAFRAKAILSEIKREIRDEKNSDSAKRNSRKCVNIPEMENAGEVRGIAKLYFSSR